MNTENTTFQVHTKESAPEGSLPILEGAEKAYGRVPNLIGVLAEAPAAVEAYTVLGKLFTKSSLTPTERHVVWFTINARHDCRYCMAAHTAIAKSEKVAEEVIESARSVESYSDPKLEALRKFTLLVIEQRGEVSKEAVAEFIAAGFTKRNLLEILVGVAHKVLSNYTNHITETPVDDQFKSFVWEKTESAAAVA